MVKNINIEGLEKVEKKMVELKQKKSQIILRYKKERSEVNMEMHKLNDEIRYIKKFI